MWGLAAVVAGLVTVALIALFWQIAASGPQSSLPPPTKIWEEAKDLIVEPLFDEDRILIVPAGHSLYERDSITLVELAGHDLLLEAKGTGFRDVLDQAAEAQGIELKPKAELDGMRLLASLVFAGFGAGIVPASAIPPNVDGSWRRIPVHGVPGRSVGLARRRRGLLTAAQRVVADQIRATIASGTADVPGVYPTVRHPG